MFRCTTIALAFLASAVASLAENTDGIFIRNGRPFAKLDSGAIQGAMNAAGTVASFRGIPYALPPVGSLRFQKPVLPAKWSGIKETVRDGAGCPQHASYQKLPAHL